MNPLRMIFRFGLFLRLVGVFIVELIKSSWQVAAAVLWRNDQLRPAVVAVPIRLRTDLGIAALACLITLTPGTTALHVSPERDQIYIHLLDGATADESVASIKTSFEDLIRRLEE